MSTFDFTNFSGRKQKQKENQNPQTNLNISSTVKQPIDNTLRAANNYGNVAIKGKTFTSSYDSSKSVIIEDLKVTFTQDLFNSDWSFLNQIEVNIEFYLTELTKSLIIENFDVLQSYFPAIELINDINHPLIKIKLNNLLNFDLRKIIQESKAPKIDTHFTSTNVGLVQKKLDNLDDWQTERFFKDQNGEIRNRNIEEDEKDNNSMSISINKQYSHSTISTYTLNTNFIDFEKEVVPKYEDDPKTKLINSTAYHYKESQPNKQRFNHSIKGDFNAKGSFATVSNCNSKNFIYNITINQLMPNKDLLSSSSQGNDTTCINEYKNITIKQFIDELCKSKNNQSNKIAMNNDDNKDNDIIINSNTTLICSYIAELESVSSQLSSSLKQGNCIQYKNQIEKMMIRIKKEISTLKLLKILFLNCFMPLKTSNDQYQFENIHIQSKAIEVKTMRKKKLIEWLIEERTDSYIQEQNAIKDPNEKILHSIINGQIQNAVNICYRQKYTYLSMLISQLNNPKKTKSLQQNMLNWSGMILNQFPDKIRQMYELMSLNDINKSIIIDNKADWKNMLIQLALYGSSPNMKINDLMNKIEQLFNGRAELKIPFALSDKNVYDINYILLELYTAIEDNDKDKADRMIKMLSYSKNIFNIDSDHHIQFIVSYILVNTIHYSYIDNNIINDNSNKSIIITLKRLNISLLIKTIEELCLNDASLYWHSAIKLLNLSSIPNSLREKTIKDIVSFVDPHTETEIEEITQNQIYNAEALGCLYFNQFKFKEALEEFKLVGNYNLAIDIYINTILINDIILSSINIEKSTMDLKELGKNCSNWDDYGGLFYEYLLCKNKKNQIKVDVLINLIQRWIGLEKINSCYSNKYLFSLCKAIIIFDLRDCLNKILKGINERNKSNIMYIPNSSKTIVSDGKYMEWSSKIKEFNNGINGVIQYKNKVFSILA